MYLKTNSLSVVDKSSLIRGEKLEVIVVYADLRNFAEWSLTSPANNITRVIEVVYERVIQLAFFYKHTFHKFLGDGFVLIWEVKDHKSQAEALHWAIAAAFEIHKRYWYIAEQLLFPSPLGFGIGVSSRGTPVWRFEAGFDRAFTPAQFAAFVAAELQKYRGVVSATGARAD